MPVSPLQLYVWDRCFLLLTQSLLLPSSAKPRRRPSATMMLARSQPFEMEGAGEPGRLYEGVLLAPNVARNALKALGSSLVILDIGITAPAYARILPLLHDNAMRVLSPQECAQLRAILPADAPDMDEAQASATLEALLSAFGTVATTLRRDPRIEQVLALIEKHPLDGLSLPQLAKAASVSESRLRALFQQELGCAPMPYIRWAKTWEAIRIWRKGMSFTEAAHRAGFYDLAHVDHALKELFGMNPSTLATAPGVHFLHCGQ